LSEPHSTSTSALRNGDGGAIGASLDPLVDLRRSGSKVMRSFSLIAPELGSIGEPRAVGRR
jgi:hypothetical protein